MSETRYRERLCEALRLSVELRLAIVELGYVTTEDGWVDRLRVAIVDAEDTLSHKLVAGAPEEPPSKA